MPSSVMTRSIWMLYCKSSRERSEKTARQTYSQNIRICESSSRVTLTDLCERDGMAVDMLTGLIFPTTALLTRPWPENLTIWTGTKFSLVMLMRFYRRGDTQLVRWIQLTFLSFNSLRELCPLQARQLSSPSCDTLKNMLAQPSIRRIFNTLWCDERWCTFCGTKIWISMFQSLFLYFFTLHCVFKRCSTAFLFPGSFPGHTAAQAGNSLPLSRVVVVRMQLSVY